MSDKDGNKQCVAGSHWTTWIGSGGSFTGPTRNGKAITMGVGMSGIGYIGRGISRVDALFVEGPPDPGRKPKKRDINLIDYNKCDK